MNSANETLRAIRQQKAITTKKYNKAIERITEHYNHDMEILNKEEKKLMEQFKDIPKKRERENNNVQSTTN